MKKVVTLMALFLLAMPFIGEASQIVFSGEVDGQFDLFRADLRRGKIVRLTKTESAELMSNVAPDGNTLAFISDRQGANSLYMASLANLDETRYVSAGMGAYANPCFSPDGSKIVVQYAPDPEEPFKNTKLVILDYKNKTQEDLFLRAEIPSPENSETLMVVDRPLWISKNLIAYVVAEFADEFAQRLTRSTLFLYDLNNKRHIRLGGGESYYNAQGMGKGFKAAMPTLIKNGANEKVVAFVGIKGSLDRFPVKVSVTGNEKGKIALNDPSFFGPLLRDNNTWIYGIMNDGIPGVAFKANGLDTSARKLNFKGRIIYPALIRYP
ncbi:MAG: TolB family protein [Candidatus Rifleibacteriota bacterium]